MIRTVRIPTGVSRLASPHLRLNRIGQSDASVTYLASTCTVTDPVTGLCLPDVYLGDSSNPLPGDPGAGSAVADWALGQGSYASNAALNQSGVARPASFSIAESLMAGNIPSPLPGVGVTVPEPFKKYLLYGLVAAGVLIFFTDHGQGRSRR